MKFEYRGEDIYWHFTDAEIDILKKQKHLVLKEESIKHIANVFGRIATECNLKVTKPELQMKTTSLDDNIILDDK